MKARIQASLKAFLIAFAMVAPIFTACERSPQRDAGRANPTNANQGQLAGDDAVISAVVTAEETCIALSGKMNALSKGLIKLRLPAPDIRSLFAEEVTVVDIGPAPGTSESSMLELQHWPVAQSSHKVKAPDLWRPLLDVIESFEHARVFVIDGEHPRGDPYRFESNGGFEALARMKAGEWRSFSGKMKLIWERPKNATSGAEWRI